MPAFPFETVRLRRGRSPGQAFVVMRTPAPASRIAPPASVRPKKSTTKATMCHEISEFTRVIPLCQRRSVTTGGHVGEAGLGLRIHWSVADRYTDSPRHQIGGSRKTEPECALQSRSWAQCTLRTRIQRARQSAPFSSLLLSAPSGHLACRKAACNWRDLARFRRTAPPMGPCQPQDLGARQAPIRPHLKTKLECPLLSGGCLARLLSRAGFAVRLRADLPDWRAPRQGGDRPRITLGAIRPSSWVSASCLPRPCGGIGPTAACFGAGFDDGP